MTILSDQPEAPPQAIDLAGRQRLTILRRRTSQGDQDVLQLLAPTGTVTLTLRVGPEGTQVELGAASLALKVAGDLALDAQRIAISAREGISISSGADLVLTSGARLTATAQSQQILATTGDVSLYANDDVKLDGERIRMNC